jgi:hypothetical protein
VIEQVVPVNNIAVVAFKGFHGDGVLTADGDPCPRHTFPISPTPTGVAEAAVAGVAFRYHGIYWISQAFSVAGITGTGAVSGKGAGCPAGGTTIDSYNRCVLNYTAGLYVDGGRIANRSHHLIAALSGYTVNNGRSRCLPWITGCNTAANTPWGCPYGPIKGIRAVRTQGADIAKVEV